ncbi:MAG: NAD-dependent epimerase/dehydratase family protein [Candidatus Omnitrophica bacterium]|nr:NAD-dependent epimerase/dehydratase family protein [Candidatus Omnitrophota bacterium]
MKQNVFVTGGFGFVGRHIVRLLAGEGAYTISVLTRHPEQVGDLRPYGVRVCIGDITDAGTMKDSLKHQDIVIHCAALMSNFDRAGRKKFFDINVRGTEHVVRGCDRKALKRFIHMSSVGVYGATGKNGAAEDSPHGTDLSLYEWSKKEAEKAVLDHAGKEALPYVILRPSQLYGEGMYYGWPSTMRSIRRGTMVLPGPGTAKIHLLNVADLAKAVGLFCKADAQAGGIYNVAGPEILSLKEVFNTLASLLGKPPVRTVPFLPVYCASLALSAVPDVIKTEAMRLLTPHRVSFFNNDHLYITEKLERALNFTPAIKVRDGFRRMIAWCERERII